MAVKKQNSRRSLKRGAILSVFHIFYVSAFHEKRSDLFYILIATHRNTQPFDKLTIGQDAFSTSACDFKNCFIADNVSYFEDARKFDAVLFNAVDLYNDSEALLPPNTRSNHQKYIFVSTESATNIPIRQGDFDGYFNWTWTYRLDSDIPFRNIVISNGFGELIGPNKNMHWLDTDKMAPPSSYTMNVLRKKCVAAAWFASNCEANNRRLEFAYKLKIELNKYGERLDIYGPCGHLDCPKDGLEQSCHDMIARDYFFYLAFENTFSVDYVTDNLLTPLKYFAVPIVYGGANYTRFMPDGIYLNARSFVPEKLATEIVEIIHDKKKYYEYFKWHRYFSYSHCREGHNICELCAMLNNHTQRTATSVYMNFSLWWNESQSTNLFEPEDPSRRHSPKEIFDTHDRNTTTENWATQNSIKEFISNVLQYYETI